MTIRRHATLALALLAFSTSSNADNPPTVQLVDSTTFPPPVAPVLSAKADTVKGAFGLLSKAGPWYNEKKVRGELQKNFDTAVDEGLQRAKNLGQRGALIKIEVLEEPVPSGTFYSLRGNGASFIGIGPDADSVCYAQECYVTLNAPIQPGKAYTSDSGYVFVEKSGSKMEFKKYQINVLESRASQMRSDVAARSLYNEIVRAKAIDGLGEKLLKDANSAADRKAISDLLQNRAKSIKQYNDLEKELAQELIRERTAAATAANIKLLSGALSLASAIAMANSATGVDVEGGKPGSITSMSQLDSVLAGMASNASSNVNSITVRRGNIKNDISGNETDIIQIIVKKGGMQPSGFDVFNPKP